MDEFQVSRLSPLAIKPQGGRMAVEGADLASVSDFLLTAGYVVHIGSSDSTTFHIRYWRPHLPVALPWWKRLLRLQ